MPEVRLQFGAQQESGHEALAGAAPAILNAFVDAKGAVRRRPGLGFSEHAVSTQIDSRGILGLYRTLAGWFVAVGGVEGGTGQIYRVTSSTAAALTSNIPTQTKPTFAETEAIVALAMSGPPRRVDVTSPYAESVLGGSPPHGAFVVAHAGRLAMDDPAANGRVRYSAPAAGSSTAGHEQWTVTQTALGRSGFFTAEARPDPAVALAESTDSLFVFGSRTTQVFIPDPSFVYAPTTTRTYGCVAPRGVIQADQAFAWLDHERRFIFTDGRSFQEIGQAVRETVQSFDDVSDVFGFRLVDGPLDAMVWAFPTQGIAFSFQQGVGWGQWYGVDWQAAHGSFIGTKSGFIGELSVNNDDDLGVAIPYSATTGFQSHGTDARKLCKNLRLVLKRGLGGAEEAVAQLQWRDDFGPWTDPLPVGLGATGDFEVVVSLRSLGAYRRRQWRFSYNGLENLVLAAATEEFEVLGY